MPETRGAEKIPHHQADCNGITGSSGSCRFRAVSQGGTRRLLMANCRGRLSSTQYSKSYSSNIGTWRASLGPPFRWRRVAPMTASTVKESSAVRGTKMRCVLDR